MKSGVGFFIGLLILAGLFLPNSSLVAHPTFYRPQLFRNLLDTMLFFMPALGLVTAALLLRSGLNRLTERQAAGPVDAATAQAQPRPAGWAVVVPLVLSLLLLAATLANLYWLTVWDSANDSFSYFLLVVPVLVVFFCGIMLSITLKDRVKSAGFFFVLVLLGLMFAVSALGQRVDFRQLTEARAGKISQAIETYYARAGRYPQDLRQLTPWTMLSIPGPVIINGQVWCYQTGIDNYALGYITRDFWSSPILTGRVYQTQGPVADLAHLCDDEMAALRISYPNYPWNYAMAGE